MEEQDGQAAENHADPTFYPYLIEEYQEVLRSPHYEADLDGLRSHSPQDFQDEYIDEYSSLDNASQQDQLGSSVIKKVVHKNRSAYNLFIKDRVAFG